MTQRFVRRKGSSEEHAADVAFAAAVQDILALVSARCGEDNKFALILLMSTAAAFAEDHDLEELALNYIDTMRTVWIGPH